MNRHTAREKAFQILFQLNINNNSTDQVMDELLENEERDVFLTTLVEGVINTTSEIDAIIVNHLENWSLDRIAFVEKTILRIATYEIHFLVDIPKNVSINEAIELGNTYGDEKSGKFINGVLSKIIA
ncbi:transcription antitermination factor NusB [Virgibacillus sp. NKC19-3]|uniref:transcription antitermination factor NusB n=1 Tax=Virgibacillus saliphilus TaxID=2831674 RepID=UPI001C9A300D|nr:transcription antitermination factor NusB [Virgibacillus sp. NKC19-3]MBY7143407.1 transcription antitermination factor NusB [Virgibacillus sp. NKC19-3]